MRVHSILHSIPHGPHAGDRRLLKFLDCQLEKSAAAADLNVFLRTIFLRWGIWRSGCIWLSGCIWRSGHIWLSGCIWLRRSFWTICYLMVTVRFYQIIDFTRDLWIFICCNKFTFGHALQKNAHPRCAKSLRRIDENVEAQDKRHSGGEKRAFFTGFTVQTGGNHQTNAEAHHAEIGSACTGRDNGDPVQRNEKPADTLRILQCPTEECKGLLL